MTDFNFNKYLKNNPLLKETSGYGNYTQPEKMLEADDYDYQSAEDFDLNPQDGENDPLGPDEELMEGNNFELKLQNLVMQMSKAGLDIEEVIGLLNGYAKKLQQTGML